MLFLPFYIFKNGFSKLIFKNDNLLSNKGSKSMLIKLLVYFYTMIQLPTNCILMHLITYFMFEAQVYFMWSLKKFKAIKSYMLLVFILYVVLVFPIIVYTVPCIYPIAKNLHHVVLINTKKTILTSSFSFQLLQIMEFLQWTI
jgi:hypothetical protein